MEPTTFAFIALATVGAVALAAGLFDRFGANNTAALYMQTFDEPEDIEDEFSAELAKPFAHRAAAAVRGTFGPFLSRVTPQGLLEKTRHNINVAGMNDVLGAEEVLMGQAVFGGLGLLAAVALMSFGGMSTGQGLLALVLLPLIGGLIPSVIIKRKATERSTSMFMDLPDSLDLLAISVEAGVGFEAALDVVCSNFNSALADEFRRTLQEMELGMSRREALQNMKARTDVPELSTFIMALTQADALGMPIGRVLHTQAIEMRNKRRQWAREKAAKLPVKILFPLVFFIFPAVLVVLLGPAAVSIAHGFATT